MAVRSTQSKITRYLRKEAPQMRTSKKEQKLTAKYQIIELSDTDYKMAIFIVFEEIKSELEDSCGDHRLFEKEPNIQYNYQNERLSGQVL